MPNWCYTDMYVIGPKIEIKGLCELLHKWTSKSYMSSSWDNKWLGNVLHGAGFKNSDEAVNGYKCRGYIEVLGEVEKLRNEDGQYYINVQYESAWYTMQEMWYAVLEKYAPNCDMIWYAEELGCGVYETNDNEKLFFKDDYFVNCFFEEENPLYKVFEEGGRITCAELEKKLSKILGNYPLPVLIDKANHMELGEYEGLHIYKIKQVCA